MRIDLNADLGEVDTALDAEMLQVVTSASVACGGHAGDRPTMRLVSSMAYELGVQIGAHPSYPDRAGFGRRPMSTDPEVLRVEIVTQVLTLAEESPEPPSYIKPHGALYHAAASDPEVAQVLVSAAVEVGDRIGRIPDLMGQADGLYLRLARLAGIPVIREAFADRAYHADGRLVDRSHHAAVIAEEQAVIAHVRGLAEGRIRTVDGEHIDVVADSVCVHGDTPGAVRLATRVRQALTEAGIGVAPP